MYFCTVCHVHYEPSTAPLISDGQGRKGPRGERGGEDFLTFEAILHRGVKRAILTRVNEGRYGGEPSRAGGLYGKYKGDNA